MAASRSSIALVAVAGLEAAVDPVGVDLGDESGAASHGDRERLGAAHASEPGGHGEPSGEGAVGRAQVAPPRLGEGLVRSLEDSLRPDVDPRAGRHLAVHRQAESLETPELVPRPPFRDEVGVGDEDPRRVRVGAEDRDGLARLDEERLFVAERLQLAQDRLEAGRVAGGLARAAVDDEVLAALGHVGIEVVQEHPVGRFREPGAAAERRPARKGRRGVAGGGGNGAHTADVSPGPERAASADRGLDTSYRPGPTRLARRASDRSRLTGITRCVIFSQR